MPAAAHEYEVIAENTPRDGHCSIASEGLPDHDPGQFSNRISEQAYTFRVPLNPVASTGRPPQGRVLIAMC
ncbi:MAG: hypothetical protein V3V20_04365 [Algisphaera sp.]